MRDVAQHSAAAEKNAVHLPEDEVSGNDDDVLTMEEQEATDVL